MKALNYENEPVLLNENESSVFMAFCTQGDEFEERFSLHPSDLSVKGLTANQIKGYLSQLSQKEVIMQAELPNRDFCWLTQATIESLEEAGIA